MKVNISSIHEERGAAVSFNGCQKIEPGDFEALGIAFTEPAKVDGKVTNTGEGFLVEAKVQLSYRVNCSRCLQEISETRDVEVKEEFVHGLRSSDETVYGFTGDIIDLTECLRDQIILALPMKFLCNPECKGFCSECGKNLNLETCQCLTEKTNHQFEILKNLFSTEGGGADGKSKK